MDRQLAEVLAGKTGNYMLPFYWQQGNHTEQIPAQIESIYQSGCRAFCVESRTHPEFGADGWWRDMDLILAEAKKRGMQVWILDDDHFPTGHAAGKIKEQYPHLAPRTLIESHVDFQGPAREATALIRRHKLDDELLAICAFRRTGNGEELCGEPIVLTDHVYDDMLCWDVPEGFWRVFYVFASTHFSNEEYIDMLREESVRVLIDAVYEPHYAHYKDEFGTTLAGFFADEPCFQNHYFANDKGFYSFTATVGQPGVALPWTEDVCAQLAARVGVDPCVYAPLLWFDAADPSVGGELRYAYMDIVTQKYADNFAGQVGKWCEERGVAYIGHIIEDMNAHTRLACSAGHFFRAQQGQHMSGIDIVLHQVMPGFAHLDTAATCAPGLVDAEFFHNVLGQLGASSAANDPVKRGLAMCEVFGAYGWAEGSPMMKWLIDFLLVRGINRFVPHAFSPSFPNYDCPPHFGAGGKDPQFAGFAAVMDYAQKTAHLFEGAARVTPAAILYHAEAEWMNGSAAMLVQKPARRLYEAHINYDIVCADHLKTAKVENGTLVTGGEYRCLVVPYAPRLPAELRQTLNRLAAEGLRIVFVDGRPADLTAGETAALDTLADHLADLAGIGVAGEYPLLRYLHARRGETEIVMLVNEDTIRTADTTVTLPFTGAYTELSLQLGTACSGAAADGKVAISLPPCGSVIFLSGTSDLPARAEYADPTVLAPTWRVSLAPHDDLVTFTPYCETAELFNLTRRLPRFSGRIRYEATVELPEHAALLDLGALGHNAEVTLNGIDCGLRFAPPYVFDVTSAAVTGENKLTITVANTLANAVREHFSTYVQMPPSGLLGPVRIFRKKA